MPRASHAAGRPVWSVIRTLAAALALSAGCAQIESPSGGPVDREAPQVLAIRPDSASMGNLPDTISILFSKKMNRGSVRDWLFVNPPVEIQKRRWEGNRLDLILYEPPDSGRTYSILLGSEVVDERGNSIGPWESSFSTGPELDDGVIEGVVRGGRLRTGGVYLYLWPWTDSLDAAGGELPVPLRMGQARKDGTFRIISLPRGSLLRLCALYDVGGDRGYDPEEDLLGCLEEPLQLDDTTRVRTGLEVYLVLPDEPGEVRGTAVDSSCIGRGVAVLTRLGWEADSLAALIDTTGGAAPDTLLGFAARPAEVVDTLAVRARLASIDSLLGPARLDSARCALPVIVRLFEDDTTLVAEERGSGEFAFRDLSPGIYRIRAFRDADANGRPGPGEPAGAFPFPVRLKPGREIKGLEFLLKVEP